MDQHRTVRFRRMRLVVFHDRRGHLQMEVTAQAAAAAESLLGVHGGGAGQDEAGTRGVERGDTRENLATIERRKPGECLFGVAAQVLEEDGRVGTLGLDRSRCRQARSATSTTRGRICSL